jgi:hypothetical protein
MATAAADVCVHGFVHRHCYLCTRVVENLHDILTYRLKYSSPFFFLFDLLGTLGTVRYGVHYYVRKL